jgi:Protein of unknown function (DUF1242)
MSALFDFKSFCICSLLSICACTYVRQNFPSLVNNRHGCSPALHTCRRGAFIRVVLSTLPAEPCIVTLGRATGVSSTCCVLASLLRVCACRFQGILYKATVIGTRLSPAVSVLCVSLAIATLFFKN